jgi:hypothetical protein
MDGAGAWLSTRAVHVASPSATNELQPVRGCIGDACIRHGRCGKPGLLPRRSRAILTDHPGYHRTSSHQARAVIIASPHRSSRVATLDEGVVTAG